MTDGRAGVSYREDYFDDPGGWAAVKTLLLTVFDVDVSPLDRMGGRDRTLMSSAWFDGGCLCVANLSAFAMPLVIDGRPVSAAGLQSGAVLPEYRGRGLFRDLLRRTLQRCAERGFEAIVLYTDKPDLYAPYGFVVLPEYRFVGPAPAVAKGKRSSRTLDRADAGDLSLLRELLEAREPVSFRFAVGRNTQTFLLNTALVGDVTLSLLPEDQAVVAWRYRWADETFTLLDVVGTRIPSLPGILQALALQPRSVEILFPPDRMGWTGDSLAEDGDLRFMMRGGPVPAGPFRLSPMAEF